MKWKSLSRPLHVAGMAGIAGVLAGAASMAAAGGYVTLSKAGDKVLTACHDDDELREGQRCRVQGLPGEPGYELVAMRSAPLVYNSVQVGTLYERLWQSQSQPEMHIFGTRIVLNAEVWDSSGAPFRVNDVFRQALPKKPVSIAYRAVSGSGPLFTSGRTVQGLNEVGDDDEDDDDDQPERNNAWTDFRIDAGFQPDGSGSPNSPWLLMKTAAPKGVELAPLGLRLLNSNVDDFLDAVDLYTASYQPIGVPPPDDDDDDGDE